MSAVASTDRRAITRAARERQQRTGGNYTKALRAVRVIAEIAEDNDWTFDEAEAFYDDPGNEVACENCCWTYKMLCPECPGCGCYNGRCSGWRHEEYMHPDELADLNAWRNECPECGGDVTNHYDCQCG